MCSEYKYIINVSKMNEFVLALSLVFSFSSTKTYDLHTVYRIRENKPKSPRIIATIYGEVQPLYLTFNEEEKLAEIIKGYSNEIHT